MSAILILRSISCDQPATSFGDDLEIFVEGISVCRQLGIDKGQCHKVANGGWISHPFDESIKVSFKEDSDPAGEAEIGANDTGHKRTVKIKEDGRYTLRYRVLQIPCI